MSVSPQFPWTMVSTVLTQTFCAESILKNMVHLHVRSRQQSPPGNYLALSSTLDTYKNADAAMAKSGITNLPRPSLILKWDAYWTVMLWIKGRWWLTSYGHCIEKDVTNHHKESLIRNHFQQKSILILFQQVLKGSLYLFVSLNIKQDFLTNNLEHQPRIHQTADIGPEIEGR